MIDAARLQSDLDGGEPVNLLPESGLFDAQDALFRIQLDVPKSGPHSIVVEVLDESGNRGVTQTTLTVEAAAATSTQAQ